MTISKAYHGESGSIWYLLDDNGDPVESTNSIETVNLWRRWLEEPTP